jgi:hypothetical protein
VSAATTTISPPTSTQDASSPTIISVRKWNVIGEAFEGPAMAKTFANGAPGSRVTPTPSPAEAVHWRSYGNPRTAYPAPTVGTEKSPLDSATLSVRIGVGGGDPGPDETRYVASGA